MTELSDLRLFCFTVPPANWLSSGAHLRTKPRRFPFAVCLPAMTASRTSLLPEIFDWIMGCSAPRKLFWRGELLICRLNL